MQTYYEKLKKDPRVLQMDNYIQHGRTTTYEHCIHVAEISERINRKLHLHANRDDMLTGALLHDFFLYDWHDLTLKDLHGFRHPKYALRNAKQNFRINKNIQNIIQSHMFPLTITTIPKSKEAWIVCFADKYVSVKETVLRREKT